MSNPAFGNVVKESDLIKNFLTGPGEFIVARTLQQMASVPAFRAIFGPFAALTDKDTGLPVGAKDEQRWADYNRYDWSMRQLPTINVYEAESEDKTSPNAWLNGTVNIQVFWPPNQRRSDWSRVPASFKGALQGFFESQLLTDMLDELYFIQRPAKVPGLNEYGKIMVWSPNIEGIVEAEFVPVTLVSVKYRIDLRAWYRAMEFDNRTKQDPFNRPLSDLKQINGEYDGVLDDLSTVEITVPDNIKVNNP